MTIYFYLQVHRYDEEDDEGMNREMLWDLSDHVLPPLPEEVLMIKENI